MFQDLQYTDLYRSHNMNDDFDGGCFSVDISKVIMQNDQEVFQLLDAVCRMVKLHPLSDGWRKLSFEDGKTMLQWAFQNDLAYGGTRLGKKKTNKYCKIILDHVNAEETICFTNCSDDPWKENGGRSWYGISSATFDIAVVVLDKETLVLAYLTSED